MSLLTFEKTENKPARKSAQPENQANEENRASGASDESGERIELLRRRRRFPETEPQVCLCVLSCGRLQLLEETLRAVVDYMETSDSDVKYEIVWVDNGSPSADVDRLRRAVQVEKMIALGGNYGTSYGLNTAFFRMCSAEFVVTLEEDWRVQTVLPQRALPWRARVISASMAVLRANRHLSGIYLRNDTMDQWLEPGPWQQMRVAGEAEPIEFRTYCADITSGIVFGAYTNGASIYLRETLMATGSGHYGEPNDGVGFPFAYGEANFAVRMALIRPCSAIVRTLRDCEQVACNGVFEHIGGEQSIMRPKELQMLREGKRNLSWVFFDTPLMDAFNDVSAV